AHALTRCADTADAVYRHADAAARAQRAQPHPRGIGARAGQDTTAPAVGPAGTPHMGMRAHPRASYLTCLSRPVNRAWCPAPVEVTSPRPRPSATESSHTGRSGRVR